LTATGDGELRIVDQPEAERYEARLEERVVGFAEYRRVANRIVFHHTEVDPGFEGRGIGGRLAAGALEDALGHGLRIIVDCPFIGAYLKRHPEMAKRLSMQAAPTKTTESA
jgi:predicted GNAT family acetyltransferase